uniref:Fibronectin type-III domain-containing protein n=1 Tax=Hucho hucho TaxID=62062 RepID=A0A4W5KHW0_9TELE
MIQTLQSAPDTHPNNLTLVTATQTSLTLRWAPLPVSEYNGSPETVGYRVCVRRADGRGEERLEVVAGGEAPEVRGQGSGVSGQQSETMLEGLAEWTEYQLKIQAFNSIGAGPWSTTLTTHTKESGTLTHTHTNTLRHTYIHMSVTLAGASEELSFLLETLSF